MVLDRAIVCKVLLIPFIVKDICFTWACPPSHVLAYI